jgi:hypothetical protein
MKMDTKQVEAMTLYQFHFQTVILMDQEEQEIILKFGLTSCKSEDKL